MYLRSKMTLLRDESVCVCVNVFSKRMVKAASVCEGIRRAGAAEREHCIFEVNALYTSTILIKLLLPNCFRLKQNDSIYYNLFQSNSDSEASTFQLTFQRGWGVSGIACKVFYYIWIYCRRIKATYPYNPDNFH